MITGAVNADYEAVIRLRIQGPAGEEDEVEAIIDTGFNGFRTLAPSQVTALGLTRLSRGERYWPTAARGCLTSMA